jgi:23S rRNA (uridine2552-2'-O)-methyltransferase
VYRRKDAFYTRAKVVGYRSRAAFKLEQLTQRARLFRRGDRVIDVGAWPGGWLQVAAQHVGPTGKVIGIDLQRIEPLPDRTVVTVCGDVTSAAVQAHVHALCAGKADVVLSDLAPKLSGVKARDEAHAQALAECVLRFAAQVLKPDGKLVVKLFMSADLEDYLAQLRQLFRDVRTTRPEATRKGSAEVYALASGFGRGPTAT